MHVGVAVTEDRALPPKRSLDGAQAVGTVDVDKSKCGFLGSRWSLGMTVLRRPLGMTVLSEAGGGEGGDGGD